jgi:hypothetical protein
MPNTINDGRPGGRPLEVGDASWRFAHYLDWADGRPPDEEPLGDLGAADRGGALERGALAPDERDDGGAEGRADDRLLGDGERLTEEDGLRVVPDGDRLTEEDGLRVAGPEGELGDEVRGTITGRELDGLREMPRVLGADEDGGRAFVGRRADGAETVEPEGTARAAVEGPENGLRSSRRPTTSRLEGPEDGTASGELRPEEVLGVVPRGDGAVALSVGEPSLRVGVRRLISDRVVGRISLIASSGARSLCLPRTGLRSRGELLSTSRNTRSSSPEGRALLGASVSRGPESTTAVRSSWPRRATSPGSRSRVRWGLAKSRSETTVQPLRSMAETRARPVRSTARSSAGMRAWAVRPPAVPG